MFMAKRTLTTVSHLSTELTAIKKKKKNTSLLFLIILFLKNQLLPKENEKMCVPPRYRFFFRIFAFLKCKEKHHEQRAIEAGDTAT